MVGTELTAEGTLLLGGLGSGEYLDLPDNLVSGLSDATFEVWLTWSGGNVWQRIFDFGANFEAPNGALSGSTYLFLTPKADYCDMPARGVLAFRLRRGRARPGCDPGAARGPSSPTSRW